MSGAARVEAVLLAAGRSRRMGAFKPLLRFGARSVVASCVENLLGGGAHGVVAVVGHRAEEVRAELSRYDARVSVAVNEDGGSEMGVSIARGVEALSGETRAVLLALADQPAVPPSVVREVVDAWRGGAALVVPTHGGRGGHPVLVDLRFRSELLALPTGRGLRALFDAHRAEVLRLPVDSPYIVRDMDTWDEYAALHAEVFGRPPEASAPGGG